MMEYVRKNGALLFLFLCIVLISACTKPCRQWEFAKIKASCPSLTYTKAYLSAYNTFNGIDVELLGVYPEIHLYLNVCVFQSPDFVDVEIYIQDQYLQNQCFKVSAEVFSGKQRAMLPDDAQELIINALLNGSEVRISTENYSELLTPNNFLVIYNKIAAYS